ncbi:uncharacterized protein TNCV_4040531 [Trichonephila clavipes]|nr:uncharacterized protein TNCV_4040531 [Trichonephila clavipes]
MKQKEMRVFAHAVSSHPDRASRGCAHLRFWRRGGLEPLIRQRRPRVHDRDYSATGTSREVVAGIVSIEFWVQKKKILALLKTRGLIGRYLSTKLACELNIGVSRLTDHLTGTSAHAPQCLGCQVIYSQFGLAIHQNDHQARRRFVEWAQNEIAVVPDFHKRILFSDEAHFWLNGYVNKQNCHIWSEANPQVYVETPLHPEKLTVWCALWAGGILLQKR